MLYIHLEINLYAELCHFSSKKRKRKKVILSGCVRRTSLACQTKHAFMKLACVKLPELLEFWLNKSMSTKNVRKSAWRTVPVWHKKIWILLGEAMAVWYGLWIWLILWYIILSPFVLVWSRLLDVSWESIIIILFYFFRVINYMNLVCLK